MIALQRGDGTVLRSGFLDEALLAGESVIVIGRINALPPALRSEVDREALI